MKRLRRTVLLTGATGFLGRGFLERFSERYELMAIARGTPPPVLTGAATWIKADLREPLPIPQLPKRVDAIVHLASLRTPSADRGVQDLFAINAGAVAALLEYARAARARRFVLGSTGGIYGYRTAPIRENAPSRPFDAYTLSKWHGETIARRVEDTGGLRVAIVRYFFPYGPQQQEGIINRLASRIVAGEPVTLHANGRHPRINPVFIADACELTRRALDANTSLIVNCAGPEVATIRQIATVIGDLAGIPPRFEPSHDRSIGDMIASTAHARRALRFVPSVGLRDGLAATVTTA